MAVQEREGLLPIRWRRGRGNGIGNVVSSSESSISNSNTTSSSITTSTTAAAAAIHHQRTRIPILRNRKVIIVICLMVGIVVNFASLLSTPTSINIDTSSSNEGREDTYTTHKEVKEKTPLFNNDKLPSSASASVNMWIAGMAVDADKIHSNIKDTLIQLNCHHQVGIHVILKHKHQIKPFQRDLQLMQSQLQPRVHVQDNSDLTSATRTTCAPIIIQLQDHAGPGHTHQHQPTMPKNRIDRIATIRDSQRNALHQIYSQYRTDIHSKSQSFNSTTHKHKPGIIILVDLDLFQLPKTSLIVKQAQLLHTTQYQYDAICAAGITMGIGSSTRKGEHKDKTTDKHKNNNSASASISAGEQKMEPWYYDTFATVFLPDTFSHPTKRRLVPHLYRGEDPSLVRSNDQRGNFTQGDIYRYFLHRMTTNTSTNTNTSAGTGTCTRVKSCFGGMAMYRAASYFEQYCQYQLQDSVRDLLDQWNANDNAIVDIDFSKSIIRYANNKEQRPCEHVAFHDCLMKVTTGTFNIAVNPLLQTFWKRDF